MWREFATKIGEHAVGRLAFLRSGAFPPRWMACRETFGDDNVDTAGGLEPPPFTFLRPLCRKKEAGELVNR